LEGARWVICMGVHKEELILSVRTRTRRGEAGGLAQVIVEHWGSAGGHGTMAGGQITLKGENPERMARQLGQRALEYLKIPETAGRSLI
jgi:nanoRNase/pAp phosphatase (c-di-AMP/oligoRNAs hydrolase)